jgi:hypothetical protein
VQSTKYAIALLPLLAAAGLSAGCDAGGAAEAGRPAAAFGNPLTCGSVVDPTGYARAPLTVNLTVASLTALELSSAAASIQTARPAHAVTRILDAMAVELMGYSGSRLADDAQAFALAEENYDPDGPVETSYARPMSGDIRALQRDCPDGTRLGRQWRAAGVAPVG